MRKYSLLFIVCLLTMTAAFGQWPANGGPDIYGYTYETFDNTDSRYSWVDISTKGTEQFGMADDNFIGPIEIGFGFDYYWVERNQVWIGSNGYVSFGKGFNISSTAIGFPSTPTADANNELLAAFMCDLSFAGAGNPGRMYTWSNNVDSFVVSYVDVPFWTNNAAGFAGQNSFQVIMNAADSTIKYQYDTQQGVWNSSYDMVANPMVVGIENLTGNIGLQVANNIYPTENTGVIFEAPATAGIDIFDVGPVAVQNDASQGFFLPIPGSDFFFNAQVGNLGNTDITTPITVEASASDTLGQLVYMSNYTIDSLNQGDVDSRQFSVAFNPPLSGPYALRVSTTNTQDFNATNNTTVIEAVAVDTAGGEAILQYVSDNRLNIDQVIQWAGGTGNSGYGMYFEPTGYPAEITAIEFWVFPSNDNTDTIADGGFRAEIYNDAEIPGQVTGQLLFNQTVDKANVDVGDLRPSGDVFLGAWNRITLPAPILVEEGGFYVGWFHLNDSLGLGGETAQPISRRGFEVLDGTWAPHRSLSTEDYNIRVITDVSKVERGVSIEERLTDVSEFSVYPNPASGIVNLNVELKGLNDVQVRITDLQGRKVYLMNQQNVTSLNKSIDLSDLAKGIYTAQVITSKGVATRKIVLK
ncbi:T9SS type A sorting domain-containing protein [bacterium]|nr:T9SS type A sorting domain-containing protein [bacterium]